MKIITDASIKVIKFSDLKIGDNILWGNWKRKVTRIDIRERTILVDNPYDDTLESLKAFTNYYVIKSCEEVDVHLH